MAWSVYQSATAGLRVVLCPGARADRAVTHAILHYTGVIAAPNRVASGGCAGSDTEFGSHATDTHPGEQTVAPGGRIRAVKTQPQRSRLSAAKRFPKHERIACSVWDNQWRLGTIVKNPRVHIQIRVRSVRR